ncbi:MAG TPA: peptide chain release factor N(5)-glutamine methyltransferase [Gammaproteobacteria bacterium]|nr:peptide chain release factor N(5)-glutamine methyltransferase [Gammaproteobacteria bacterium]
MSTIQSLLKWATEKLESSPNGLRDAQLLLQEVLGCSQVHLYSWPGQMVDNPRIKIFQSFVERRAKGEPIAYILGHRAFWTIDLKVTPVTLIPRAETEGLVEVILETVKSKHAKILELGTGCGAIALALAKEKPYWEILATDSRPSVLELARENAKRNEIKNVGFVQGNWFSPFNLGKDFYDVVVSNPPYVAEGDPHLELGDLRFEPKEALIAGPTGLEALEKIIKNAKAFLKPGGLIVLEHGASQGEAVLDLFAKAGFGEGQTRHDLAHLPRVGIAFNSKA